jgi:two-component SAPR family response regulator
MHEDPTMPEVRIILLLTYGCNASVLYNIARFHISDYLAKPVTGTRLAQRIRSLLASYQAERSGKDIVEGRAK